MCVYRQIRDALYDDEVRGHICTAAKSAKRQFGRGTTSTSSSATDANKGDAGTTDHAETEGGAQTQTQGEPLSAANAAEVKSIMAEFEALIEGVRKDAAGIAQDSSEGDEDSDGEREGQGTQESSSEEVIAAAPVTVKKTAATATKRGMRQMHACKILYHTHIILVILCAVLYIGKATSATPATTSKKQVTSKAKPKKAIKKAALSSDSESDDDDDDDEEEEQGHYSVAKRGGGKVAAKAVKGGRGGKAVVEKHSDDCLQDTDSSDSDGDDEENDENTTNKPATAKKRDVLKDGGKTSKTTTAVAPSASTTTSKSVGSRSRGGAVRA